MPNNVFKNSIAAVVRHRPARNWAKYYCSKVVTNCGEFVTVILLPPSFVWQIAKCVQASLLKVTEIGLFVTFFFVDIKKKKLKLGTIRSWKFIIFVSFSLLLCLYFPLISYDLIKVLNMYDLTEVLNINHDIKILS